MAVYKKTSPYHSTKNYGTFLDVMEMRKVSKLESDVSYTISKAYHHRPDLLAFDLYGDPSLWWVFAARNPNIIKDPVFDFRPGVIIRLPKKETLVNDLGL